MRRALCWMVACMAVLLVVPITATAAEPVSLTRILIEPVDAERQYGLTLAEAEEVNGILAVHSYLKDVVPGAKMLYGLERHGNTATIYVGVDQGLASGQKLDVEFKLNCTNYNTQFSVSGPAGLVHHERGTAIPALTKVVLAYSLVQHEHLKKLAPNESLVLRTTTVRAPYPYEVRQGTHVEVALAATKEQPATVPQPRPNRIALRR